MMQSNDFATTTAQVELNANTIFSHSSNTSAEWRIWNTSGMHELHEPANILQYVRELCDANCTREHYRLLTDFVNVNSISHIYHKYERCFADSKVWLRHKWVKWQCKAVSVLSLHHSFFFCSISRCIFSNSIQTALEKIGHGQWTHLHHSSNKSICFLGMQAILNLSMNCVAAHAHTHARVRAWTHIPCVLCNSSYFETILLDGNTK